jgi:ABC-2 type transport system ATP-binding protein
MVERTGLGVEQHKLIGTLSKGYRQRVGLAQAMLHDPEVLILDEPTSGLDPNQLVEIRGLIRQLGQEKTVIFSTHIMQEVQALSDRVVIINRGRLVADGTIGQLQRRVREEMVVTLTFAEPVQDSLWRRLPQVREWRHLGGSRWRVTGVSGEDIRGVLFRFAVSQELTLLELRQEESSVEDVFQQLTGKGARAIV